MDYAWSNSYCPNLVCDSGNFEAKLIVCAEAPGESEDTYEFDVRTGALLSKVDKKGKVIEASPCGGIRKPLVGKSGQMWVNWLKYVGLDRDKDMLVTNVFQRRPEDNDFRNIPPDMLFESIKILHEKISKMPNVNLIVPMGNKALEAITGKIGVTNWRGSILEYIDLNGRKIKVIPTLHPAMALRNPNAVYFCYLDWQSIAYDLSFAELNLVEFPEPIVYPTIKILDKFIQYCYDHSSDPMSIDIENDPETHLIQCIGFCINDLAVSVPLEDGEYWTNGELDNAWARVQIILDSPNPKIAHHGFHDFFYTLRRKGIGVKNWIYDTMAESHCLIPTAPTSLKPHSLANVASLHMRGQYWKNTDKDAN